MIKTIFAPIRKGDYSNPFGAELYNSVSKTVRRMASKFYSILSDAPARHFSDNSEPKE